MAEAFLQDADAQAVDAAIESLHVVADLDVALARIEAVGTGDDLEQQRIVGTVAVIGPHTSRVISSGPMPV